MLNEKNNQMIEISKQQNDKNSEEEVIIGDAKMLMNM